MKLKAMSILLEESPRKKILEGDSLVEESKPAKPKRYLLPQIISTTVVSWLSIQVGYASAYSSPAESSMTRDLNLTRSEVSWICSLLPVGALVGSLSGGPFIEFAGRKKTLIVTDFIFLSAWSINYFSQNHWNMYASRILSGYGVGVTSFAVPVYLAETLQPKIRGRLGLFPTAFGNFGILTCFILGNLLKWRGLAVIGMLLTLPFLLVIWLIPETPRWYISKRKIFKARASLQWLRGKNHDINTELEELYKLKHNHGRATLFTKLNLKILAIVLGMMFFQQFSGINAIIFYATHIFEESGSSVNAFVCTAIIGIVNFISTFIAAAIVDRLGRKILMYISSIIMANMLALLGIYFYLLKAEQVDLRFFEWLPLSCFILYVLGFSLGLGPIPWLMMGEILPAAVRGSAASICAAFNWSCTFVITKTFPLLVDSVGAHYVFWFFGVIMVFSLVFLKLFVPETKKRTLEDIERMLSGNIQ